jgi:hypothetical protein
MTTSISALAASLGHEPEPAEWPYSSADPVPMERFGKDHWSTFAFVECRTVDHRGLLDHDRMRCSVTLHPWMMMAKRSKVFAGASTDASGYPSIVKGDGPDAQGRWGRGEIHGHDDYSCLDDLIAAGLLAVTMPGHREDGFYVDPRGKTIRIEGQPVNAGFLTGLVEKQLAAWAVWSLTDYGQQVAGVLRAFKAQGGSFHDFTARPAVA